jgi:prevent-host-death family protein
MMKHTMSATEARIHFGELMRRVVERQDLVIVEHSGKPHVVIVSVEEYKRLQAAAEARGLWQELVPQARARVQADLDGRTLTPPEDVLHEVREARDEQLTALR